MTIVITRLELSAADLRDAARRTRDAKAARRMIAIALVLEGWSREAAAEAGAMDRQTLCDWVHRYNELGLAGLFDRPRRNGPPPRLSAEQQAAGWRHGWTRVRHSRGMAWYVGAVSICSDELRRSLRCNCMSARWANCCANCRSDGCRYVPSTHRASPRKAVFSAASLIS